jgi:hypothetical protein
MKTTTTGVWSRIKAGDWVMTIWVGDAQVTYRAKRGACGWMAVKKITGTGCSTPLGETQRTLREVRDIVDADWKLGLV